MTGRYRGVLTEAPANQYAIYIEGCDDCTAVVMALTEAEADVIRRVADVVLWESEGPCGPTLKIDRLPGGSY